MFCQAQKNYLFHVSAKLVARRKAESEQSGRQPHLDLGPSEKDLWQNVSSEDLHGSEPLALEPISPEGQAANTKSEAEGRSGRIAWPSLRRLHPVPRPICFT